MISYKKNILVNNINTMFWSGEGIEVFQYKYAHQQTHPVKASILI